MERATKTRFTFESAGETLVGNLFLPEPTSAGVIVAVGPLTSVTEQAAGTYAQAMADRGYAALAFDYRYFGESGGEPRFHYDPWLIVSDYVNAVAYLMAREDVAAEQVAAVGVCMGGGYAIAAAARERRLAACASFAGGYDTGTERLTRRP